MVVDKHNLAKSRNQIVVALILTIGIGGVAVKVGNFELSGIGLAAIVGILLNLILPDKEEK
jgi:uracil permease